ncbi:hypothetical protein [Salipiger sp.]|uniref:hypothetical protein n=1 Tax=Salipiger sp. TaxID=2078585 RepID=UPI003A976ED6
MDVILHLGAHRTGSTSFQTYLRGADAQLAGQGIGFWGPWRTRNGLFHGLMDPPPRPGEAKRAPGRVRLAAAASDRRGMAQLVVSDENMLGSPRACLRARKLYPDAGKRIARVREGFGRIDLALLQIRSPENWWSSAMSHLLLRGAPMPDAAALAQIAGCARGWRDVISDIACALPDTRLVVTPFERFATRPDRLLQCMTGALFTPAPPSGGIWANRGAALPELRSALEERNQDPHKLPEGEGRWRPFTPEQEAALRETYADDLFWLKAGADGMATLTEDPEPAADRLTWPPASRQKGQDDDGQDGRLAQTR